MRLNILTQSIARHNCAGHQGYQQYGCEKSPHIGQHRHLHAPGIDEADDTGNHASTLMTSSERAISCIDIHLFVRLHTPPSFVLTPDIDTPSVVSALRCVITDPIEERDQR